MTSMDQLNCYLVGGAVRDDLLGLPVRERDWVVIGHDASSLLSLGFKQVGKSFPVFLHPRSGEEYALARTERKISSGYHGFSFDTSPSITLAQDLERRDLTINALARDHQGHIIDPFNGLQDLHSRILRHVSDAFIEDPLRLLRVARFAARLPNFTIHSSTHNMLKTISQSGELEALTPERIWTEWHKALETHRMDRFIDVLIAVGAWSVLYPGLRVNRQRLSKMSVSWQDCQDPCLYFAAVAQTIEVINGKPLIKRLRCPKRYQQAATLVKGFDHDPQQYVTHSRLWIETIDRYDLWRCPWAWPLIKAYWLYQGYASDVINSLDEAFIQAKAVTMTPQESEGLQGRQIGQRLHHKRVEHLESYWSKS